MRHLAQTSIVESPGFLLRSATAFRATYSNDAVVVARKDTSTRGSSAISISYTKPSGQRGHTKWHLRDDPEPYRTRKGRRKNK